MEKTNSDVQDNYSQKTQVFSLTETQNVKDYLPWIIFELKCHQLHLLNIIIYSLNQVSNTYISLLNYPTLASAFLHVFLQLQQKQRLFIFCSRLKKIMFVHVRFKDKEMDVNRKLNIDKLRFFGPLRIYIMEQKKHPEKPNEQMLNKTITKTEDSTFSFI